jgi:hypothetical protein
MDYLETRILERAESENRFEENETDFLEIWGYPVSLLSIQIIGSTS